jgi:hypothetical protein
MHIVYYEAKILIIMKYRRCYELRIFTYFTSFYIIDF